MTLPIILGIAGAGLFFIIFMICLFAWFRVVPNGFAHVIVSSRKKIVASPDDNVLSTCKEKNDKIVTKRSYYAIPAGFPSIGRTIRKLNVAIRELNTIQETIEKDQARYKVSSSLKYRIVDVLTAAETFTTDNELEQQLKEVVLASVRAVTVKYDVTEARSKKMEMSQKVGDEIKDDLAQWGLKLVSFQLVDFQDTPDSHIISNISRRREVDIESRTKIENAEKIKEARMKEAEADQLAQEREIERDRVVQVRNEEKAQAIADQNKITKEKEYAIIKVETIKQAEIDKEKAIVKAQEDKETALIRKEEMKLEGEGIRAKAEEQAIADAAPIRERGKADAEAKELQQAALNKFTANAILALTAEKQIEAGMQVGIALAAALKEAKMSVFMGGEDGKTGFNLAELIEGAGVGNNNALAALVNKLARPNDLGFKEIPNISDLKEEDTKGNDSSDSKAKKKGNDKE